MPKKRKSNNPIVNNNLKKESYPGAIALILTGTIALCFEIGMYQYTAVSFWLPFCICIITGLVSQPIAPRGVKGNLLIVRLFYCILGYGGLVVTTLMSINYNWLSATSEQHELPIIRTGIQNPARGFKPGTPYAIVVLDDVEKAVLFPGVDNLKHHSKVRLETRRGLLGFDVIVDKSLGD